MELLNYDIPLWILAAYMVGSAAVQALPRPDETSGKFYVWVYSFLHTLAMNLALALDPRKKNNSSVPVSKPDPTPK